MEDLNKMLSRMPELLEGLIEICYQRKWIETAIAGIKFSQHMVQALWTSSHSLEQLPHIGEAQVKAITAKGSSSKVAQAKTLGEYLAVPDEEKKGLAGLSEEDRKDVLEACKLIPNMKVELDLFVEEPEEDFLEGVEDDDDKEGEAVEEEDEGERDDDKKRR